MPERFVSLFERLCGCAPELIQPGLIYLAGVALAAGHALAALAGIGPPGPPPWLGYFAMLIGSGIDLYWRSRAYARIPVDKRRAIVDEWRARLFKAGLGAAFGFFLAYGINGSASLKWPQSAAFWWPFTAMICVIAAVPLIDSAIAILRLINRESVHEAFAGTVISLIQRRIGGDRDE